MSPTSRRWTPSGGSVVLARTTASNGPTSAGLGRGRAGSRTRLRGNRVGPVAMPAWAHASWASRAAAPTATAALYSASAAVIADFNQDGGRMARRARPAKASAAAFPLQSADDSSGGSGLGRCAGTQRAVSSPQTAGRQSRAQRSAWRHSGGRGHPRSFSRPWATYCESVTIRIGPRALATTATAANNSARCTVCTPGTGPDALWAPSSHTAAHAALANPNDA